MQVSAKDWERYVGRLQAVNRAAAEVMQGWMNENPGGDVEDMIAVAYAASTYYGDAAATLACEMYDALAEAQGAELPPAEPAETATYSETAKAVRGTMKNQRNSVPDTVGRLVKLAGADTMLQNARRDGAEWAWVPFGGETCAFCITLASRGWQRQGKKAAEGDHAEHIHPHCQCEYVVRFDGSSSVEGYDPDRYLEMYENAEGRTPNEKMRSLRRELYAENKDRINEQKRIAYRNHKEGLSGGGGSSIVGEGESIKRITAISASTIMEKVQTGEYSLRLSDQNYNKHIMGHRDYERYRESRINKGLGPPSILTISKEEAQDIINRKSGTGIIKTRKDGSPMNIEEITCDRIIGAYWSHGEYQETNKAAIHHGSKGSHLVPQYGGHYD